MRAAHTPVTAACLQGTLGAPSTSRPFLTLRVTEPLVGFDLSTLHLGRQADHHLLELSGPGLRRPPSSTDLGLLLGCLLCPVRPPSWWLLVLAHAVHISTKESFSSHHSPAQDDSRPEESLCPPSSLARMPMHCHADRAAKAVTSPHVFAGLGCVSASLCTLLAPAFLSET